MKKRFFSFLLLLSFAVNLAAQTQKSSKPDAGEQNLRTHVGYLASDKLEGRRTGEAGATYAAGYIANNFANYKLKAGIEQNAAGKTSRSFLQPFPYITGVELAESGNEFSLKLSNQQTAAEAKPVGFSPNGEAANAQIVFAGFGIEAAEANFNDYTDLNVSGKIVLAFDGTPENDNQRSPFARFTPHAKAKIAKDKGALGLFLISRETNFANEKLAEMKYDRTQGEAALPTFVVSRNTAAGILGIKEAELKTIENLAAMKKDTTARIRIGFRDTQPNASFKVNLVKKTAEAYNVIGIVEGRDAVLKNEAIVIGAHYDHLGKGGAGSLAVNSTEIHHGADDNASGTSALLELARQFAKEKKNKRTLIFIAFGGEEEGLLGSKYYVNNPVFPLEKTIAMINMDMVGRLNENKLTIGGIGTASEWKDLVNSNNQSRFSTIRNESLTNVKIADKQTGEVINKIYPNFALQLNEDGFGPSDHSSFYGKQIPVLFFFTGTHMDYHKPSDTAEKINYEGLLKITNYVGEIVRAIDRNPNKPAYKVAQSANTGGRASFNVTIGVVPGYGDSTDGMLLDGVRDGSPASAAGMKAGDKIVKFAGKQVRNVQDYMFVLSELKADTEYEVEVIRGTEKLTLKVKPAAAARRP